MIEVTRSPNGLPQTKQLLLDQSNQHIKDVAAGLEMLATKLNAAGLDHDYDKLTDIDNFFADIESRFSRTEWWDNHRKIHRHHLNYDDGVPEDVNLLDVLEYIVDCTMAGMARNGDVYKITASPELLQRAFENTAKLVKDHVTLLPCPCLHCDGQGGHGHGYDDTGNLPTTCGWCEGTGLYNTKKCQ